MKCAICDEQTKRSIHFSVSRSDPKGETHRGSGKIYACGEHLKLLNEMSMPELEIFLQPSAVTEENKSATPESAPDDDLAALLARRNDPAQGAA